MRIYRVIWNNEPERYYLAVSVTDAIAQDVEAVRREWDEGENVNWTAGDEYQRLFTSIELVGELEPYEERLHTRLLNRITELMASDPAAASADGLKLAELAALVEAHEKSECHTETQR